MKRWGELQPLRATAKGNLPRVFASEIRHQFPEHQEFSFPIMSEEEDRKLWALRHILIMCGRIKKHRQKFSLTRKGEVLNEKGFSPADFYHLFQIYAQKFNWASRDLYPEFWIIQQSFLFSCYMLFRKARGGIDVEELCRCFVEAFPKAMELKGDDFSLEDPYKLLMRSFYIRFIERFCEYFGLVTVQNRERKLLEPNYLIKTTPLFDEMFQWKF